MKVDKTSRMERWTRVLVAFLTLGALATLWSVFLLNSTSDRHRATDVETERLIRSSRLFLTGVEAQIGKSRLALDLLVRQAGAAAPADPLGSPGFLAMVNAVRSHDHKTIDLRAVTKDGFLHYFTGDGSEARVSVADRDYYRLQVPYPGVGFYIGEPRLSRGTGRWGLVFSQALPPSPGPLAVLHVVVEFPTLDTLAASLTDSPGEAFSIYRSDGTLLYRYPFPGDFPRDINAGARMAILRAERDGGLLRGEVIQTFQKSGQGPFWTVVSRPAATMAGDWNLVFSRQLVLVIVVSLVALGAGLWLLHLLGQLRRLRVAQEELARIDPLTGLLNRRAFLERVAMERLRVDRQPGPLSLAILDLDHFKMVNDRFGHQVGDQALRDFGAALVRALRATDLLARIGGEEFAVLLPGTDGPQALDAAERVRAEVETIELPVGRLTTSIGVAVWDGAEPFDLWYQRADEALYRAKANGRNRVEADGPRG